MRPHTPSSARRVAPLSLAVATLLTPALLAGPATAAPTTTTSATTTSGTTSATTTATTTAAVATTTVTRSAPRTKAATTPTTAAMRARLDAGAQSRYLAGGFSGIVLDEASGATLWSRNSARTRMPASTQKVLTAYTVLHSTSPQTQLVTRTFRSRANPGNVYLKGAGDPSLSSARLRTLAARTAAELKKDGRTSVTVYADASVFPAPVSATGWKRSYVPGEVQPVRGLTLAGHRGTNGSIAAANSFAGSLHKAGVNATVGGAGVTPQSAVQVGESWSAPVSSLVGRMLAVSDNTYAEYLLRIAAKESGLRPTWTNSLTHQRAMLSRGGVPLAGYVNKDGSGLSRANRMPVRTLATTVDRLWDDPSTRRVAFAWGAMPRSGQTGTLRSRFRAPAQRCAMGRVMAKTGTLGDAVALAGVAEGVDGRRRVFAFIENGSTRTASVRSAVDTLGTAVVGCR
ncbi:D-alanyl-D-alanine carboxypeptidase/D-alanyl-D-alanine-endopeptidase [Mobilicoccus pelagius]|uniref:Peptidase S13 family protein n=1 Tax=Mobilicoccus pelagius NBRC 104925 TaxID=1089455 RepID=H5UW41_9MICO|nr:D-alanyl-D-alanine carboxypeptidase [Mobilicoccus pelagius]GAB49949.1 peptidase S13 family protein [Mobilicoccus pelagius NBRC 104925]